MTLAVATAAASVDRSTPTPRAFGNSLSSAESSAPEPTPRSRIRRPAVRRAAKRSSAASTMLSVSGRGSSTAGVIAKRMPQNSRQPRIRDKGSRAMRRSATSRNVRTASPSGRSGEAMRSAGASPQDRKTARRASRAGSSMPDRRNASASAATASARVASPSSDAIRPSGRGSACTSFLSRTGKAHCVRPVPNWRGSEDPAPRRRRRPLRRS